MYKSKRFSYTYEDWEDGGKNAKTMVEDIIKDSDFSGLEEIVIGCWGECWDEEEGAQALIDGIIENKEKFSHIKSLFVGDMDFEDCEVSWIIQGDYSGLWAAMPQLEKLTIKGSCNLVLGDIRHDKLQHLEIICGGLPSSVIQSVQKAKLPSLKTLLLYIGVEDYGFDGDISTIKELLTQSDFPELTYLGITDSEIEDEIAEAVLDCKYINQITTLNLSMGSLTDRGGQMLLDKLPDYPNIKALDLEYHFLSDEMMDQLQEMDGIEVNVDDEQEADEYDGEVYYYPMLTE